MLWPLPADESLQKRVKFLGYSVDAAGLPTFEYERDGARFRETIVAEGPNLARRFQVTATQPITLALDPATTCSTGSVVKSATSQVTLTPAEARAFTLTVRLP